MPNICTSQLTCKPRLQILQTSGKLKPSQPAAGVVLLIENSPSSIRWLSTGPNVTPICRLLPRCLTLSLTGRAQRVNGEPTPAIELFSVCTACKMTADSFRSYTADERPAKANGTGALAIAEHLRGNADLLLRHVAVVAKNGDASGRVSNCEVAYADDMITGGFNRL